MTKEKILFIYNPCAGKGRVPQKLSELLKMFCASKYEIVVHATDAPLDARNVAAEYAADESCVRIICAGGDGTLDEVAEGVMSVGSSVPVALIPTGSTNDFGYTLGIPTDMIEAAAFALGGQYYPSDIACLNGRFFTYTASFGLFADVSYDTPQQYKNAFGRLAYILNGITKLSQIKIYKVRVEYDDVVLEDEYIHGMIVSSNSVGGFRGITGDEVLLDDGFYEMILVRNPKTLAGMAQAVTELTQHTFDGTYIQYAHINKVRLVCDTELAWSLDGEYGGSFAISDIDVRKCAINYVRAR